MTGVDNAAIALVPAGPPGLLAKLVAAVRPEFRAEVFQVDPADPIFGGPACRVSGCDRAARLHGLCTGHCHRWYGQGRPDLDTFAGRTVATMRGDSPFMSCAVAGCGYGRHSGGLCMPHHRQWNNNGRLDIALWLNAATPVVAGEPPPSCRVRSCVLWGQPSTSLCLSHGARWRSQGRPDIDEFIDACDSHSPSREHFDLVALEPHLRLEMQYALQQRHDEGQARMQPALLQRVIRVLARSGMRSMLSWSEETWRERVATGPGADSYARPFLTYARRQLETLHYGAGWEIEYPHSTWRLRNVGIDDGHQATICFEAIPQPWLTDLAKRWTRWRLSCGLSTNQAGRGVTAIAHLARFLARPDVGIDALAQIDRHVLERYLADLHAGGDGSEKRRRFVGLLGMFFSEIRRHRWDTSLPTDAVFFTEDAPKQPKRLPRALAEHVMAQVELPDHLHRWDNPAYSLITLILIRCGLRISDALKLPFDCLTTDVDDAPYLCYHNHKMNREALVPIDEELQRLIHGQQQRLLHQWPQGVPVLFPRPLANIEGRKPLTSGTYRRALEAWLQRCDVRDEHGRPVHLTPHQWRHTLGTRLINRDVPQEVVRRILDHDSAEMTSHYAQLHDTTVRRHWEQARKVNIGGDIVTLDPDGPVAEASWAKQRLSRATQALPNGYCGLPMVQSCPHANSCLTCPMFLTTTEFLPQHRQHRQQTLQIISTAEARGQTRMAEMNQQVADNLVKIITTLESDEDQRQVADAS